jgi:hypothetical protein
MVSLTMEVLAEADPLANGIANENVSAGRALCGSPGLNYDI